MNLVYFYEIYNDVTTLYYDVTHFLTDPDENCTAYIKLEMKDTYIFINIFIPVVGFGEFNRVVSF